MVVLQTRYAPGIGTAYEGMIADIASSEVGTRICETVAGIPFGKAVSQGTGPKSAIIGGAAATFVGLSVRDITLSLAPIDPLSTTPNPLDTFGRYSNVAVMSRGHMYCKPQALVAPGDSVFFDATTGILGNSASGLMASGWVKFAGQPAATNTLQINGATLTFVASGATTDQANIGPTLGDTLFNAVKAMNDSATAGFAALTFALDPPAMGNISGADTIFIQDNTVGALTKAITAGPPGMTKSAGTLLGGTAAALAVTAGKWLTGGQGGQLAIVSLGIQI